jgi:hypothetical protein
VSMKEHVFLFAFALLPRKILFTMLCCFFTFCDAVLVG